MRVQIARKAGFCMGVRRAMRLALKAAETSKAPVYTYGPLIHNPQALELLEKLGIRDLKKMSGVEKGVVIIRAHGIPPEEKESLFKAGFEVLDGTCPRVAKVQALARKYTQEGYQVVLIGDKDHAEVKGILGYTSGKGLVVSNFKDIEALPPLKKYIILSQTTQDEEAFDLLSREILSRYPGGKVINTICHATHVRQESIRELARECEAIVVVGGRGSANTNRLAQIAREENRSTYLVETPEELPLEELSGFQKVGVSAGASTPNWLINGVVEKLAAAKNPLRKLLWFLLNSHIILAGGLSALYAGTSLWLQSGPKGSLLWAAFFLAFFAHTWNSLVAVGPLSLCNPYKARLFREHERLLLILSLLSLVGALICTFRAGPGYLILAAILGGISAPYTLSPLRRLFPGNRTIFITLFWTTVALLFAFNFRVSLPNLLILGLLTFTLSAFRALYVDLLDLLEDGFLGRESLAAFLGEKKVLWALLFLVFLGALSGLVATKLHGLKALVLLPLWLYGILLVFILRKRPLGRRLLLEYLGEGLSYGYLILSLWALK